MAELISDEEWVEAALKTKEGAVEYLQTALWEGEIELFCDTLKEVAKLHGGLTPFTFQFNLEQTGVDKACQLFTTIAEYTPELFSDAYGEFLVKRS